MASIICKCGKVLEMRVKLVGLSPMVTLHDQEGYELQKCPDCSRDAKEFRERMIGIQTLIKRWGPGSQRSKKGA